MLLRKSRGFVLCSVAILEHMTLCLSGTAQHCQTWFSFHQSVNLSYTKAQLCFEQSDMHNISMSACYDRINVEGSILSQKFGGGKSWDHQSHYDKLSGKHECTKCHGNPSNAAVVASEVC